MNEEVREASLRFIKKYIPSSKAVMVTGSASGLEMTEDSDIDLLILDENISRDYFETIYFMGYKFDCVIIPFIVISDILRQEYNSGVILYIDMLSKGEIIRDDLKVLSQLKVYAISLKNSGPKQVDIQTKKSALFKAYNLLDDLEAEREWNETLFIAIDLFNYLLYLNSTIHTYWATAGKWRYRYLKQFDEDFTKRVTNSFSNLISEKNKSEFLQFAKKNLFSYGEQPKQFSSRYYYFVINNNQLTISVKTNSTINTVYNSFLKKMRDRLLLFESSISMFYVYNDSSILDESNYLIFLKADNEVLNHIITPIITSFINEEKEILVDRGIISTLNYQLEPEFLFVNQEVYELAMPILLHFNRFHDWIGCFSDNKALTYLTQFHLSIGSKLGFTVKEFIDFNEFLLERWMPFVNDSTKKEGFKVVEERKLQKLKDYQQIFDKQKDSLIDNFLVVYKEWETSNNYFLEDYINEAVLLLSTFYYKLDDIFFQNHFFPKFKLNQIMFDLSDFEKKRWLSLASTVNIIYSSILLTADQKSYLSFACSSLLQVLQVEDKLQ